MATLFNTKISQTYEGLIKTFDNAAITATLKELTDGSGNQSGLYMNTAGDFKVTNILEWGSLKDTGTGVTITRFVTSTDGIENFDNNTSLPTSAAVKLYVDSKFATSDTLQEVLSFGNTTSGHDIVVSANDDITFTDSSKAIFGAGSDFEIFHNGTSDFIVAKSPYNIFEAQNHIFRNIAQNKDYAKFLGNSSVELYWNGILKFQTSDTGATLAGRLSGLTNPSLAQDAATKSYVDGLDAGSNLDITDGTTAGAVNLNTQSLSILGTTNEIDSVVSGQSVTIGLPSSISTNLVGDVTGNVTGNVTGDLTGNVTTTSVLANGVTATTQASTDDSTKVATTAYVKGLNNASDLDFSADGISTGAVNLNSQVFSVIGTANQINSIASGQRITLSFPTTGITLPDGSLATTQTALDNSTKVATTAYVDTSAGLYLPLAGGTMTGNTIHNDSVKSLYGTGSDAEIYHDGTDFIVRNSTGNLEINQGAVNQSIIFKTSDNFALDVTALTISDDGNISTGASVTIAGDLTVNGTTTTINTQTLSVEDPLIELAKDNAANSIDIGFYGKYNDGSTKYLGLFSDASDSNKFKLFKGLGTAPTTTVNTSAGGYEAADLLVAGLEASLVTSSGNVIATGDVIANTHFNSSDTNATLSTTGAGTVFLRPNGKSDPTGQLTVTSNGVVTASNNIVTSGTNATVFADRFSGISTGVVLGTTGAGTIFLRPSGVGATNFQSQFSTSLATIGTSLTAAGSVAASGVLMSTVSSSQTNLGTASGGFVKLYNTSNTDNNFSQIGGYNSNNLVTGQINFINTSQANRLGELGFATHNGTVLTERMRINSDGLVGIKTSNPSSQLTIGGNAITTLKPTVAITDGVAGASLVLRGLSPILSFDKTGTGNPKILTDGGTLEIKGGTLDAEGDVLFSLTGAGATATFAGNINFGDSHFIGDDSDDNLLIQSSAGENVILNSPSDDLLFRTAGTTRLQLTDALCSISGTTTIGATTSTAKLNVGGKLKITDDLIMAQTNGRIDYDNGVTTGALRFYSTSGSAERMRLSSAGILQLNQTTSKIIGGGDTTGRIILANSDTTAYITLYGSAYAATPNLAESIQVIQNSAVTATFSEDNRVGIGISEPAYKLHVHNPSNVFGETGEIALGVKSNDNNDNPRVVFQAIKSGTNFGSLAIQTMTSNVLTEKFRISPIGTELIGSNSARNTVTNLLTLNGGTSSNNVYDGFGMGIKFNGRDYSNEPRDYAYINSVMQVAGSSTPGGDPSFSSQLQFWTNSGGATNTLPTQKMVIEADGSIGIGTANPNVDLDLRRIATAINDDPTIRVRNAWNTEGNNTGFSNRSILSLEAGITTVITKLQSRFDTGFNLGEVGTATNHDFRFIANGGEKMRIDNGGNIRVGTGSTPETLFQIYATTTEDPAAPGSATTGKFCINTSQQATLSIGKNAGNEYWISNVNRSFANVFYNIVLNPLGGKVGIAKTSPNATLDVNGDIQTTGNQANTLEFSTFFSSGTTTIATLSNQLESTTAVANIEYVGLYSFGGTSNVGGILMAITRYNNTPAWSSVDDETVSVFGDTSKEPTLFWDNGVLKLTVPSSVQITGRIRITYHNATLTRNHTA